MSILLFEGQPVWAMVLSLVLHFAAGIGLGVLYFYSLWWNTRLFARRGGAVVAIALMIGRFAFLGGLLVLASLEGALPLLMMALGVLIARFVVTRRVRRASP